MSDTSIAYREGQEAAKSGVPFSLCPYNFKASGLPSTDEGYRAFDANWRQFLNAWFKGWDAVRKEAR